MPKSITTYIKMQEIGPVLGNMIINPFLAWLGNRKMESVSLFGDHSIIIDTAITSVAASLLVTLFAASGVRRDLKAGRVTVPQDFPQGKSLVLRLPRKSLTLGLSLGIAAAVALVSTALASFRLFNIEEVSFITFLVLKAVYTAVLGLVVAHWAILRELVTNRFTPVSGGREKECTMETTGGELLKGVVVDSPLGKMKIDSEGAPIAGVRMDASRAYAGVPRLLQEVIDADSAPETARAYAGYGAVPEKTVKRSDQAWTDITKRIDYIYANLDHVLAELDRETGLAGVVQSQIRSGKKLFLKPNLVAPSVIDPSSHGEGAGDPVCTQWPLVAALMRWFHDKLDISYHQMALGEASTSTFILSHVFSISAGRAITTEAVIEGRSGDFYAGWGVFFVRRYLAERHAQSHTDDPMKGHEDSVAGRFIPPGRTEDRLMVYDLNKIQDQSLEGGETTGSID